MDELLGYVFSPLRKGDIELYRGSGNGLGRSCLLPRKKPRSVVLGGLNTNMRSKPNLTLTGRRDQSR